MIFIYKLIVILCTATKFKEVYNYISLIVPSAFPRPGTLAL